MVDEIEYSLSKNYYEQNVSSQTLGDEILIRLQDIDSVAYVRFASVYKDFKDINEFNEELKRISAKR